MLSVLAASVALSCAPMPDPETRPAPVTGATGAPAAHEHPAGGRRPPTATPEDEVPTADAQFLQHMIPHHAQALYMTVLVPSATSNSGIRLIAERIQVSQKDEIAQMQSWLRFRRETVPSGDPAHSEPEVGHRDHVAMPGMLSADDLGRLTAARGSAFDRLFLELMIRHHEGAITMVQTLFAAGGGQESQIFAIASEVESDQRMEIARMQAILAALPFARPGSR